MSNWCGRQAVGACGPAYWSSLLESNRHLALIKSLHATPLQQYRSSRRGALDQGCRNWLVGDVKTIPTLRPLFSSPRIELGQLYQVMLPGMKQRIVGPWWPQIGHTMVRPARFGSLIKASSGTSTQISTLASAGSLERGMRTR